MNLDPENCPHCGITWLGEPIPDGSKPCSHYGANMVLILAEPENRNYYLCNSCGAQTPLGIGNYGYKPEFLTDVFLSAFGRRGDADER